MHVALINYDVERLPRIGWKSSLPDGWVVRVVARHRSAYEVHDGHQVFAVQAAGHFLRRQMDPTARPAVGDFVRLVDKAVPEITNILPRRSTLMRAAAGERYAQQVIATNIDYVFIVTGLDADYNERRIERYLSIVADSGAVPVVVLTKADMHGDADTREDALRQRLGTDIAVHGINTMAPHAAAVLLPYLKTGDSVCLVGSSGVGKSTLTNTLLGEPAMATASISAHTGRGRHTTTHRALLTLPSGGCLIDTPGMREIKLTGDEDLSAFADIEQLAAACRFNDCAHEDEPGCALRQAVADGRVDASRLQNYRRLLAERERRLQARDEQRWRRGEGRRPRGKNA